MTGRWFAALLFVAGAVATVPARGEAPPEAMAHEDAGTQAYHRKDFRRAIDEYRKSFAIDPAPQMYFNLAQAHRQLGEYGDAIAFYRFYLAAAPPSAKFRVIAERQLRELERRDAGAMPVAPAVSPPAPRIENETAGPKQPAIAVVQKEPTRKSPKRAASRVRRTAVAIAPSTPAMVPVVPDTNVICSDPHAMRAYERCAEAKKNTPETLPRIAAPSIVSEPPKPVVEPPPKQQPAPARTGDRWSLIRLTLTLGTGAAGLVAMGVGIASQLETNSLTQRALSRAGDGSNADALVWFTLEEVNQLQRTATIAFSIAGFALLTSTLVAIMPRIVAGRANNITAWIVPAANGLLVGGRF